MAVGLLSNLLADRHAGHVAADSAGHYVRCSAQEQAVFADVLHGLDSDIHSLGFRLLADAKR